MVAIVIEQSPLVGEQGELRGTFCEFGHEKVQLQGSIINSLPKSSHQHRSVLYADHEYGILNIIQDMRRGKGKLKSMDWYFILGEAPLSGL